jgi:hypothetical protein
VNDLIGGQIDYMCLNMGIAGTLSMLGDRSIICASTWALRAL